MARRKNNVVAFPIKGNALTQQDYAPQHPKDAGYGEALGMLSHLLTDRDREQLFEVMYRLHCRHMRQMMDERGIIDPDDFLLGINQKRLESIEEVARRQAGEI